MHNKSVQISVQKTPNKERTSKEDTMNINQVNTVKFNNMNIESPIGPEQQIPFRGGNKMQDSTTNTSNSGDKIEFKNNFEGKANAAKPAKNIFSKIINWAKDFAELKDPGYYDTYLAEPSNALFILG